MLTARYATLREDTGKSAAGGLAPVPGPSPFAWKAKSLLGGGAPEGGARTPPSHTLLPRSLGLTSDPESKCPLLRLNFAIYLLCGLGRSFSLSGPQFPHQYKEGTCLGSFKSSQYICDSHSVGPCLFLLPFTPVPAHKHTQVWGNFPTGSHQGPRAAHPP